MNRPDNMSVYKPMELKLGIKSSLPDVKSTLGLFLLMWECLNRPSEIKYSVENGNKIILDYQVEQTIRAKLSHICEFHEIEIESFISRINKNNLFTSQIESLMVALGLVWRLGEVCFVDSTKSSSAERTGGNRYPKKIQYSVNVDIIHILVDSDWDAYIKILMSWIGIDSSKTISIDKEKENKLLYLLNIMCETTVFKLVDGENGILFNQNSLYKKILETHSSVDINGDEEPKGALRILKNILSEKMNPFLEVSKNGVEKKDELASDLSKYQKRVDIFLKLSEIDLKAISNSIVNNYENSKELNDSEINRITTGTNILLYGVPGSGKSWTIQHEYCTPESHVERLVFHPDYTYSDFVGQILPNVAEDGQISYKFTPGPFTSILRDAYEHPEEDYVLIIEEINRGNAPAIFGEVFQLLDRKVEVSEYDDGLPIGTSEYGITNPNIANVVYGDPNQRVRIPSNLSIIGTMNTSDQNVFTLDTAFQRRWEMRLIENNFDTVDSKLADARILDTTVTWRNFCTTINDLVIGNSMRMASSEDKRLGAYFVHVSDLTFDERMGNLGDGTYDELRKKEGTDELELDEKNQLCEIRKALQQNRKFPEKVIKYLWDDAFKFNRESVFEVTQYHSLEEIIKVFLWNTGNDRFMIFKENIRNAFTENIE